MAFVHLSPAGVAAASSTLLIVVAGFSLSACSGGGAEQAKVDDVAKLPCKADNNKNITAGKASRCLLEKKVAVGPYTCQGGKMISTHAKGELDECTLEASTKVQDVPCQESFSLYADGKLRRCKTTAKGAKNGIAFEAGNWVTLSPGGNLRRLEAREPQAMGGYTCQGYFNYFHENGKLARCDLAKPADVGGKRFEAKASVCFDDKGTLLADCKKVTVESFMR